ncbi:O-antigen ligase family protein [Telmatospirillum sp.]|uniref:O-antigen ligase family protein n=1 Tax=Telmatospirillum sp. TaxID=2079197 RepID=UPI00283BB264|nr:O-antigen ligase family protein [Telmatospirillum sp.]MDR3438199.1 O-antigen ligase family protein [Telmatospirillum sp.]
MEAPKNPGYASVLRTLFWLCLSFALLSAGAVDRLPLSICALILSLIAAPAVLSAWNTDTKASIYLIASAALLFAVATVWLQTIPIADLSNLNDAWSQVRQQIGIAQASISVVPDETAAGIVAWCPLLAFVVAGHLYPDQTAALRLMRGLCYVNVLAAIFGIIQFFIVPDSLGISDKVYYIDSLSSVFVNRNSAGTFFGCGLLLGVGFAWHYWRAIPTGDLMHALLSSHVQIRREHMRLILFLAIVVIDLVALSLTRSRGAIVSTIAAAVLLSFLLWSQSSALRLNTRFPWLRYFGWGRYLLPLVTVGLIATLFTERAAYRLQTQGADEGRLCTYQSTWRAIVDNWPSGSGFNTFTQVFPAYRDSTCVGINGFWNAAHNSYLEGLLGLGLPFAILLAVGYAVLLAALVVGYRLRHRYRFAPAIGLSVLLLVSIHAFVDFSMQIPAIGIFIAATMAGSLTVGLSRSHGRSTPSRQSAAPTLPTDRA